jgi:hypothetical protein
MVILKIMQVSAHVSGYGPIKIIFEGMETSHHLMTRKKPAVGEFDQQPEIRRWPLPFKREFLLNSFRDFT